MAKWQGRKGRPWRRVVQQVKGTAKDAPLVCWLCGHEIDLSLPPNHRYSYTTDHVVPRSHQGPASAANARPAHRRCNSSRGNRISRVPMRRSRVW